MPRRKAPKSNTVAVGELVDSLRREQQLDTHGEALAALALTIAAKLDEGEPVMMTSAWARELRQTLALLMPARGVDDDDDDWTSALSAEVRDTPES
jgi:hypothetical protein